MPCPEPKPNASQDGELLALTSILIYMNKNYQADGAGIRFTGLTTAPPIP